MKIMESRSAGKMVVDSKEILNFGGCGYLGLCDHQKNLQAASDELLKVGAFGQIPRHYGYINQVYLDVEKEARLFFDSEDSLYFSGGYAFASIAFQALIDEYDIIFLDESSHYSVIDGAKVTGKKMVYFNYVDPIDLDSKMKMHLKQNQRPIIATDGMFPTYGNLAPVDKYYDIARKHGGWLLIDESHSFGIIGPNGRGVFDKYDLSFDNLIVGGSTAKGFGAYGGLAVGNSFVIRKMANTTAYKGAAYGMTAAARLTAENLKYIRLNPSVLIKARANISRLKQSLNRIGLSVDESDSPVVSFELESKDDMINLQNYLEKNGVFVMYSTYVGAGPNGVIRIASYPDHTEEDIQLLCRLIQKHLNGKI